MFNNFRYRLNQGEQLIGTIVTLNDPSVVEILCKVGFDWLFIDTEHAPLDMTSVQFLLQAAGDVPCVIRVPSADEASIKKALDIGAAGIIVPQVNSAEQAEQIVQFSKYPPLGSRGVGIGRAHGYGLSFQKYLDNANDSVAIIVQAEHSKAVENIDSISKVEGIDAILVGPNDLAASMGKLGKTTDLKVLEAIDKITKACLAANIRLGFFGISAESLVKCSQTGYNLLVAGIDSLFLIDSARNILRKVKDPKAF